MDSEKVLHNFLYSEQICSFPFHSHDYYEIIYICEGEISVISKKKSYNVGKGDMVFISYQEEHEVKICSQVYRRYSIQFTSAQMNQIFDSLNLKELFLNEGNEFLYCICLSSVSPKIEKIFQQINQEYCSDAVFSNQYIMTLMKELVIICYREKQEYFSSFKRQQSSVVLKIQQYIDKNFWGDITVKAVAAYCHFSPSYLSHVFKEEVGYSIQQYLIISRVTHAKKLLLTTDLSINDISIQSGFNDVNSFIRIFKKKCGVSPGKFRKYA